MKPLRFHARFLPLVLSGEKTVTRRKVKSGGPGNRELPCKFVPGDEVSIAAGIRGQVLSVRREYLRDIDNADAVREGFPDRSAFLNYWWGELYPPSPNPKRQHYVDCAVYRIEFALIPEPCKEPRCVRPRHHFPPCTVEGQMG